MGHSKKRGKLEKNFTIWSARATTVPTTTYLPHATCYLSVNHFSTLAKKTWLAGWLAGLEWLAKVATLNWNFDFSQVHMLLPAISLAVLNPLERGDDNDNDDGGDDDEAANAANYKLSTTNT